MREKTAPPTTDKIDELAHLYIDAQAATEMARAREAEFRDQLISMVEAHGTVPRRATKSKRLEGDEYQATLSRGHSVEVNSARAELFRQWMKAKSMTRLFRRLFRRESVFVLQPDAQALVATIAQGIEKDAKVAADLVAIFHQSITIQDTSPTLRVEPRKKEEKKSEAAA